jgi:hypothetical protein
MEVEAAKVEVGEESIKEPSKDVKYIAKDVSKIDK